MRRRNEWFASWFDSKWYHLLYRNRNEAAAGAEISSMLRALDLPEEARVLDLACGKGRHSVHLAHHGFDVTGLDISSASIDHAKQFEHPKLHFYQHDMRLPFRSNYYHAVFNLFTSFGYFETMRENRSVLRNIGSSLVPGGVLLLDFFNQHQVRANIIPHETKVIEDIRFDITKHIEDDFVVKSIRFSADGKDYLHQERVQLLTVDQFHALCQQAGLQIDQQFGNYDLSSFDPKQSPRFIFTARKIV